MPAASKALLAMMLAGLLACGEPSAPPASEELPPTNTDFLAADLDASESMQRLVEARAAREAMPGRPVFEEVCASCHDEGLAHAPHTTMIQMMTPAAILRSLTDGVMKDEAAALTDQQRTVVAEYLAGRTFEDAATVAPPQCESDRSQFDYADMPIGQNWGIQITNTRRIPESANPLPAEAFDALELKWAFAYPGANRARSQPSLAGGAVHVGSHSGIVYALDRETGCVRWTFQASGEVRTGIVFDRWSAGDETAEIKAYFGDILGNVYAINAVTGELVWRDRADPHPNTTITGTPSLHKGRLFVTVSALETGPPIDPAYECCKFRGSLVAYDAATGDRQWQAFTVFEEPSVTGQNRSGTDMYGPSGAGTWNAPAIDVARNQIYFGTAQNLSSPATQTSDAVFAVDMDTGDVNWVFQGTPGDAWNGACDTVNDDNCPVENGPDFDMAAGIVLASLSNGLDLVIGAQKSGMVHALDPDSGEIVWQNKVGRGGIQGGVHFGMAADGDTLYVPVTDMPDGREYAEEARPGLYALDMKSGDFLWKQPAPTDVCQGRAFCHPGISQVATAAPGYVMAGAMDGVLRVHDSATGDLIWSYDTTAPVETVSGEVAAGGSLGGSSGPITAHDMLLVNSGYGLYFHMPGNVLLVFGRKDTPDG
ncbi:MAG: PQQ-binding-like beta-propeller repeat protein [Alphaproteobacteria bacterium]